MSVNMATLETGLASLIRTALGLAQKAVLWANQNAPQPDTSVQTWAFLTRGDMGGVGVDGVQSYPTAGAPPGQEVTLSAQGVRTLPVSVHVYSRAGTTGASSAFALLVALRTKLRLPSNEAALLALGLGLHAMGPVRTLDALLDQAIQGHASVELLFNLADTATETTTYIERVKGQLDFHPAPADVPVDSAA